MNINKCVLYYTNALCVFIVSRLRWEKENDLARTADVVSTCMNSKSSNNIAPYELKEEKLQSARKVDEHKKVSEVMKKFQGKNQTCCPHLFSQKPANTNPSPDQAAQNTKTAGRKKVN